MRIPALCLHRMQAQQAAEEPTIKGEAGGCGANNELSL
jgi:hypothetical protein